MGAHNPDADVSVEPTCAVPVIVGVGAVSNTPSSTVFGRLNTVFVLYPEREAMVATETFVE